MNRSFWRRSWIGVLRTQQNLNGDKRGRSVADRVAICLFGPALLIGCGTSARAQDLSTAKRGAQAQPAILADDGDQPSKNHLFMGIGVSHAPVFQGGGRFRVLPVPIFDYSKGRFFANVGDGVGVNVVDGPSFTVGASVAYLPGYRARDVPTGVGALDVGIGARGFVITRLLGATITTGVTKGVLGGNRGMVADASISMSTALSKRIVITPSASTTWANVKYNDRYFGITPTQSRASGLSVFKTSSGIKDVSLDLTVNYVLSPRWILGLTGSVTSLVGNTRRSPLVMHATQPASFLSINYAF